MRALSDPLSWSDAWSTQDQYSDASSTPDREADWAIFDHCGERSGDQPFSEDDGADVTRLLGGSPVPSGATEAAAAFAISVGWAPEDPTFFRKNLKTKSDVAGCRLQTFTYDDMTGLFLKFVSWVPTS
jgi:hypothetical protein